MQKIARDELEVRVEPPNERSTERGRTAFSQLQDDIIPLIEAVIGSEPQ